MKFRGNPLGLSRQRADIGMAAGRQEYGCLDQIPAGLSKRTRQDGGIRPSMMGVRISMAPM